MTVIIKKMSDLWTNFWKGVTAVINVAIATFKAVDTVAHIAGWVVLVYKFWGIVDVLTK